VRPGGLGVGRSPGWPIRRRSCVFAATEIVEAWRTGDGPGLYLGWRRRAVAAIVVASAELARTDEQPFTRRLVGVFASLRAALNGVKVAVLC